MPNPRQDQNQPPERMVTAPGWTAALAARMGQGWRCEVLDANTYGIDRARLRGPGGQRVFVRFGGHRNGGRVALSWDIAAELTQHAYGDTIRRAITVAQAKPIDQVAREVTRRLLPGLAELIDVLTERARAADQACADRDTYLARMARLVGGTVHPDAVRGGGPSVDFGGGQDGGSLTCWPDGTLELTMRLPRESMATVMAAVAQLRTRRPTRLPAPSGPMTPGGRENSGDLQHGETDTPAPEAAGGAVPARWTDGDQRDRKWG